MFGTVKSPKFKVYRDSFIFKNFSAFRFEEFTCTNRPIFFFSWTWSFVHECKTTNLVVIFSKIDFILFFKCDDLI